MWSWILGTIGVLFLMSIVYNIGWHVGEARGYSHGWLNHKEIMNLYFNEEIDDLEDKKNVD